MEAEVVGREAAVEVKWKEITTAHRAFKQVKLGKKNVDVQPQSWSTISFLVEDCSINLALTLHHTYSYYEPHERTESPDLVSSLKPP